MREALAEAAYQRCYVHFLRNALDYVPRRVVGDDEFDAVQTARLQPLAGNPASSIGSPGWRARPPELGGDRPNRYRLLLLGRLAIAGLYVPSGFGKLIGINGPGSVALHTIW